MYVTKTPIDKKVKIIIICLECYIEQSKVDISPIENKEENIFAILYTSKGTSVTRCANPSMGMSAMIRAHSLNLLVGMELG